jgi:hypothetical protein
MTKKLQRIAERGAIVEQAAIDYVTCSTYDGNQYAIVRDLIDTINVSRETPTGKTARGYDTTLFGWASYGEGTQKGNHLEMGGKPHFLINANGKEADILFKLMLAQPDIRRELWNFSRLDIQLTIPRARDIPLGILAIQLEDGQLGEFKGKGKPKPRGYTSDTGHTLYIGSASSQKQIRFYDKPLIKNRKRVDYERFEIQYRDDYANPLATRLFKQAPAYDRSILFQTLKYQYSLLPSALQTELSFRDSFINSISVPLQAEVTDKTEAAKLRWFKSLKATIRSLARDNGQTGMEVRAILLQALVEGSTQDELVNWMDYRLISPDHEIVDPL